MEDRREKKRSGLFWVGVTLLAISVLFLLILVLGIVDRPEETAFIIGGGLMLSAIPIAIGIYCVSRSRRETTLAEGTLFAKDTKAEIVIRAPSRFLGAGWFLLLFGISCFPLACMVENRGLAVSFIGLGLSSILLGVWLVGWNTKVTFNQPPGYITVTRGQVPLFLWFLRAKVISSEEARSVRCPSLERLVVTSRYDDESSPLTAHLAQVRYLVEVVMKSGRKLRLYVWQRCEAEHLVRRILEFSRQ